MTRWTVACVLSPACASCEPARPRLNGFPETLPSNAPRATIPLKTLPLPCKQPASTCITACWTGYGRRYRQLPALPAPVYLVYPYLPLTAPAAPAGALPRTPTQPLPLPALFWTVCSSPPATPTWLVGGYATILSAGRVGRERCSISLLLLVERATAGI